MVKLLRSRCFSQKTGRIIPERVAELIRIRTLSAFTVFIIEQSLFHFFQFFQIFFIRFFCFLNFSFFIEFFIS